MGRAITEKTNTVRLTNHTASMVSVIEHLRIGEQTAAKFQTHSTTASSTVTNQSTCTRCGGLLVNDSYMDALDGVGESKFPAKRCVQCGEVIDFVILINRQQGQQPMTGQLAREILSNHRIMTGQ